MTDFIHSLVTDLGLFGIAVLMFLENVFPPIPSELIMPLAGVQAQQGAVSLIGAIVAGTIGSVAGAVLWFLIGMALSLERLRHLARRYGRWLTVGPKEVDQADRWFDRYGGYAVLFGRLVPTVRTFISIPAGISGMGWRKFLILSTIGSLGWVTFLTLAGYFLGRNNTLVQDWLSPVSNAIVVAIVLIYVYRVITFRRDPANSKGSGEGVEAERR